MAERARRTRAEDSLGAVLDFMRLLWRIEHGLQTTSKRMESRLGITGPQRLALKIVTQFPGLSAGELARILHLHPSTITGIVQRLVEKRLLIRTRDRRDTRRVSLRPRIRASTFARRSAGTVEGAVAQALRRASAIQVHHAREVLERIAAALQPPPRRRGG
jgi:DNA-binding MarR family transcriptional regulator